MKKVRLKWVKNRGLDHIIERDTDVKACCLLLEAIGRANSSSSSVAPVPARSLSPLQKGLGLTVPVLRFLRRYPTLFSELPHPRFPSLPSFSLTPPASILLRRLSSPCPSPSSPFHLRLARLLMLARSGSLPLSALSPLRFDLALPPSFASLLASSHPDLFRLSRRPSDGAPLLSLASYPAHLAVSALQLRHARSIASPSYRELRLPPSSAAAPLAFPMRFPRGYGGMNKVRAWMEEFHRLPYVSPYDDPAGIDPDSDLMEKRVVGVLHELLSLTVHKKTKRNYIRALREELSLPHKFTRVFTRYPGIFYLSLKCKTTTVVLREGYERGKLVEPHPMATLREKVHYVMRTGLLYRGKGLTRLVLDEDDHEVEEEEEDRAVNDDEDDVECYELEISEGEVASEEEEEAEMEEE
ncbi:Protein ROOT PRIMORDIUM DEFECTIVE 1 [Ananas comosus]|uniref:Protein ROOT PRIMORDIUM DEFECTIVE 1 n=1 Tax=Ananas comosus TaxID=4615 RepID=A0A199VV55_ANACO|nr:Protein ROOT PRIMORDIUM DEFECTIVE 1 [Ananas comosus]